MVTKRPKGLGKGLDNFFGVKSVADVLDTSQDELVPSTLPIASLQPGKYQPRTSIEEESLKELSDSILANGILNPIVVRRIEADKFEILAGERRYRAALQAGLKKVPVRIFGVNDKQALIIGLVENLQREDLNVMEIAEGLKKLIEEFNYSHEESAAAIGRSRSMVTNILRLLTLPPSIQEKVREGKLDMGHARALLTLKEDQQLRFADLIISKNLSVRQTEDLVREMKEAPEEEKIKKVTEKPKELQKFEKELSKLLKTNVRILNGSGGKGKIQIAYSTKEELDALISLLRD